MIWENLSAQEFEQAKQPTAGLCILPIGCVEKHGHHLPLGTDITIARHICIKAAEAEPALVFPYYPFGQVSEVRHMPGTISLPASLNLLLLEELCKEIARNGYRKILLANGHGGNNAMLTFFVQSMLDKPRDYDVYTCNVWEMTAEQSEAVFAKHNLVPDGGHADVVETAEIMAITPDLVQMHHLNRSETASKNRFTPYAANGIQHGIGWYADYPHQIAGDPTGATAAFGQDVLDICIANMQKAIQLIKTDQLLPALAREFYEKSECL